MLSMFYQSAERTIYYNLSTIYSIYILIQSDPQSLQSIYQFVLCEI